MKNIKLSHILFSLAVIGALALAVMPAAPAYALAPTANIASATSIASAPALNANLVSAANRILVCKSVTVLRNGHRVTVRICHWVEKSK